MPIQDQKIYGLLKFMSRKKLLHKPFIRLRQNNGKIVLVFLDNNNYDKIKNYNSMDLAEEHKKIRLKVAVNELKSDSLILYNTKRLISIDKIEGKTYSQE